MIIGYASASPTTGFTWTNLSEQVDEVLETNTYHTGAHDVFATQQTGLSVSADPDGSLGEPDNLIFVMASWGPA